MRAQTHSDSHTDSTPKDKLQSKLDRHFSILFHSRSLFSLPATLPASLAERLLFPFLCVSSRLRVTLCLCVGRIPRVPLERKHIQTRTQTRKDTGEQSEHAACDTDTGSSSNNSDSDDGKRRRRRRKTRRSKGNKGASDMHADTRRRPRLQPQEQPVTLVPPTFKHTLTRSAAGHTLKSRHHCWTVLQRDSLPLLLISFSLGLHSLRLSCAQDALLPLQQHSCRASFGITHTRSGHSAIESHQQRTSLDNITRAQRGSSVTF